MFHITNTKKAKERLLRILLITIIIFGSISYVILKYAEKRKEEAQRPRSIKERVEDVKLFYSQRFKADITLSAVDIRGLHNTRVYKDTTGFGFYIEEEPIFALDVTVEEANLNTFRVIVFKDKIVELHK
mgnify:FL=1